jgi:predicted RNA-binding Zn ribbon-like protein
MALTSGGSVLVLSPSPVLCLAFANTLMWRGSAVPSESVRDLEALLAWIGRNAGIDDGALHEIRDWAATRTNDASALFSAAIALRETIFRVFESVAGGTPPAEPDFAVLSAAIATTPPRARLVKTENGYAWQIDPPKPAAAALLAPVLWSAADLLLDAGRRRIRQCANEKCLWLFVDESKSGTRRWCDMTSCGNRAKAQRHYAKVKRA